MIITKQSRMQADLILALIQNRMDDSNNAEWVLDTYNNGREHGYVLELYYVDSIANFDKNKWIAFSENRNSDHTVVYTDSTCWSGHLTNISYDQRIMFEPSEFIKASDYIIRVMENSVEDVRECRKEKCIEQLVRSIKNE